MRNLYPMENQELIMYIVDYLITSYLVDSSISMQIKKHYLVLLLFFLLSLMLTAPSINSYCLP